MTTVPSPLRASAPAPRLPTPADFMAWQIDAWQRGVLFLDVMRQRAEQSRVHNAQVAPHVLSYQAELVMDGRSLPRPVNYGLVRIAPPAGQTPDPLKRPFVVVDPRAGHGPGIGGFKADSEIGVAMKAGHPCYFIGFLPDPMPGQTIEDVTRAEAAFLEAVIARHPQAEGKPCVIGNCQAGWAVAMLAALRPELFGPIILAGAPLSYWAGVRGRNPMRYSGGLLGGSWLTALTGDLGAGRFDGAWLVQNFEAQNPANTLWSKQYNLYSKIDDEAERYLGFEKWWGGHVSLNAEEMQFIVDELFVGNKLAAAEIRTSDGVAIDLRNIRSPIVVFCSQGDNITPPQQALGWILDLYDSVEDIRAHGQTIVYTIHDRIGHLGIFVSAGVARKEHDEFASNIDMIDVLPPGLYEAVLTPRDPDEADPDLVRGDWVMRCSARTLDDIRALGGADAADARCFAAAARLSEINLALYRVFAQPMVRAVVGAPLAEALRQTHPQRLQGALFGPGAPMSAWIAAAAEQVRAARKPAAADNPLAAVQQGVSDRVVGALEAWREGVERLSESAFFALYGAPTLQAALGVDPKSDTPPRKAARNLLHDTLVQARVAELRAAIPQGDTRTALIRAAVFIGLGAGVLDERAFEAIRRVRRTNAGPDQPPLAAFKQLVREQYAMLLIDQDAALAALPDMLPEAAADRRAMFDVLRGVVEAAGAPSAVGTERLATVAGLFGLPAADAPMALDAPAPILVVPQAPALHALPPDAGGPRGRRRG